MLILFAYLLTGAIAGMTAGLLGLGGGAVIVPILFVIFHAQGVAPESTMQLALGTSLATIVFTSISSGLSHHRLGNVNVSTFISLTPGILAGALLGAGIADMLTTEVLKRGFGLFEILIALQIGFGFKPAAHRTLPGQVGLTASGGVIGTVSSVMGIGGGSLTVPFLLWNNVSMKQAVGTSAACGLPIAVSGAIGFLIAGLDNPKLPEWSLGYIYLPAAFCIVSTSVCFAPIGAKLANRLPIMTLKRAFALFLAFIGLKMLF
ncbi:MAG: sulfite exporter TauE/SafE family protein [Gammaproteobacteria bacterium]